MENNGQAIAADPPRAITEAMQRQFLRSQTASYMPAHPNFRLLPAEACAKAMIATLSRLPGRWKP